MLDQREHFFYARPARIVHHRKFIHEKNLKRKQSLDFCVAKFGKVKLSSKLPVKIKEIVQRHGSHVRTLDGHVGGRLGNKKPVHALKHHVHPYTAVAKLRLRQCQWELPLSHSSRVANTKGTLIELARIMMCHTKAF